MFRSFQVLLVQPCSDFYRNLFFWVKPKDIRKNFFKLHYLLLSSQVLGLIQTKDQNEILEHKKSST